MNKKRFVIITTLLFLIIGMSLVAFAKESSDQLPERPDPKDVMPLKLISHVVYFPPEIKQKYSGQDFSVNLRFEVSAYGYVKDVNVINGSGYSDLDDALIESAKNFIFTPTYIKNKPVATIARMPITGTVPAPNTEEGK